VEYKRALGEMAARKTALSDAASSGGVAPDTRSRAAAKKDTAPAK